ncbi:PQQ-dependent dehydrogenase, methanol/ethanol family [Novosphingobium colocasiae]|uniref:PQQ-dependent dehydrogenase, methanol/ethanol family n=1 Tax=Novosphingobium colocasiae TaxID=1256513 RepID=UPI0035AE648B
MAGLKRNVAGALLGALLASCSGGHDKAGDGNWTLYGLDSAEQRFSHLEQITPETVGRLGLAWSMDLPAQARSLQGTPLAIDGVLYFSTSPSKVYAVEAATGKQLWEYDPQAGIQHPRVLRTSHQGSRGIGYYKGAILLASLDGRLISIDCKTGKPRWIVNTIEEADSRKVITGAPRVFAGKVIVGNSGADFGTRGYVTTYDAETGRKLWRFYTVPGDPAKGFEDKAQEMAAKTWSGEWWRWGGGGTVWNGITYDKELNRIYIGVGNSSNYNPAQRSPGGGDNLFLASIVALDADTGKYVWHYQENPREAWDWKATNEMILTQMDIGGEKRPVLMQAAINGFFYILDRRDGKLLSANKYAKATWADRIDLKTGRPVEIKNARYEDGPVTMYPSQLGAHNWQAMSYNPELGLAFIPVLKQPGTYWTTPEKAKEAESFVLGVKHYEFALGSRFSLAKVEPDDGTGGLLAWDTKTGKARWTVKYKTGWNGGTLATATGLVFQGDAAGWFHAYEAGTGKELWKFDAHNGIIAPPITYLAGNRQYVTLLVGYGAAAPDDPGWRFGKHLPRVLTFVLDGKAKLPATPPPNPPLAIFDNPAFKIDPASAARGRDLWLRNCSICHRPGGGTANWPDLRESAMAHDYESLRKIVKEGALAQLGMPQFDELSDQDIHDINNAVYDYSRKALRGEKEDGTTRLF